MHIAFDAKRAFHNHRGLGNYSRDMLRLLSNYYPENDYWLMNPSHKNTIEFALSSNMHQVLPDGLGKLLPALWRTQGMCRQLKIIKPDIYHGLSQELPLGIDKVGCKTVITMHDAIFMRYPELYSQSYVHVFTKKNRYACKKADRIIAISEQTKQDIIQYFDADESKIDLVYQGCNNLFREKVTAEQIQKTQTKYNLPAAYMLTVGAIEKRKNVALLIEAIHAAKISMPLIIVGKYTTYAEELKRLVHTYKLEKQILFIHNVLSEDLPAVYSQASLFLFPSIFEGFGIPILEALCTKVPVIASAGTCFEEVGGPQSIYVKPTSKDEWIGAINTILGDTDQQALMKKSGIEFSQKFTNEQVAASLMAVYNKML